MSDFPKIKIQNSDNHYDDQFEKRPCQKVKLISYKRKDCDKWHRLNGLISNVLHERFTVISATEGVYWSEELHRYTSKHPENDKMVLYAESANNKFTQEDKIYLQAIRDIVSQSMEPFFNALYK